MMMMTMTMTMMMMMMMITIMIMKMKTKLKIKMMIIIIITIIMPIINNDNNSFVSKALISYAHGALHCKKEKKRNDFHISSMK